MFDDDKLAMEYLISRGFTFTKGGMINPPGNQWPYKETEKESSALDYLCWEWDYGYPGIFSRFTPLGAL